jgi:hypothetical protein
MPEGYDLPVMNIDRGVIIRPGKRSFGVESKDMLPVLIMQQLYFSCFQE